MLRFARYFGHPVADVTEAELTAWQDVRVDQLKPAGMHNEVTHVSCYLRWLSDTGRRADNPSRALVRPKHVSQRRPRPMPDKDIARALNIAEQPMHVWLGLAAFCGLRCCEIAVLERDWIIDGIRGSHLRVTGKGGKERNVPLPEALRTELASGPFRPAGHLFARMDGKPGPPSAARVSERINEHLHAQGISLTAHKMRHRFGTKLYEATRDPFYVAEVMGHASVDTTRLYVAVVNDKAAQIAEQISNLSA